MTHVRKRLAWSGHEALLHLSRLCGSGVRDCVDDKRSRDLGVSKLQQADATGSFPHIKQIMRENVTLRH